ncbi:MAG: histidinol dehydrogenase [Candidatus Kapaibacterium sp.]|jgi:histidinol dehydrogenase
MKKILTPERKDWAKLIQRPKISNKELYTLVHQIFADIKEEGDTAVKKYAQHFDNIESDVFQVTEKQINDSISFVSQELQDAINIAHKNIELFHKAQQEQKQIIETTKGVLCWRENRPIEKIGIYIPGGTAPLFSTVLMLGIPAKLAGCKEINLFTPPGNNGIIHPAILFAAHVVGITNIFAVGGIQAIGAMTFGTESLPKVDKIFGPGNQYVTAAKQISQLYGAAIDMPAGPSEVLIIADETCVPEFVAADLLSQAEHGYDSQVILLSNTIHIIDLILQKIPEQIKLLPKKDIVEKVLNHSKAILFDSIDECIEFSNEYAPEHLIVATNNYTDYSKSISNAGSVFLGNYSCESAGDYASGTNHTLPTHGYARSYSGVSLDSFVKKITFQELSIEGIKTLGPTIEVMAEAEQLMAHKYAVTLRLQG